MSETSISRQPRMDFAVLRLAQQGRPGGTVVALLRDGAKRCFSTPCGSRPARSGKAGQLFDFVNWPESTDNGRGQRKPTSFVV